MTTTTTSPSAPASLVQLITERQTALNITDAELATALGYDKGVVVTLIKAGTVKLPLTKIPALADSLELDATSLLVMALKETSPELLELIETVWGPRELTPEEGRLIQACRKITAGRKVAPVVFADTVVALVTV